MQRPSNRRIIIGGCLGAAATLGMPRFAAAQASAWPNRPIRMLVGFPPGQSTDTITRMWAAELSKSLGQPVVVDNRPGAGGTIATQSAVRSAPDGYTLLGASGSIAIYPYAYPQLKLDPIDDYTHICRTVVVPLILVTRPDSDLKTFAQFIELARQRGQGYNYGSGGTGITAHLAMEMLINQGGLNLTHVPYKGSPPAINDLIGGQVVAMFDAATTLMPLLKAGKLRALAVASPTRDPDLPDVPTVAESGFPGFEALTWGVFSGPPKLPAPIVERLGNEVRRILEIPAIVGKLREQGVSIGWQNSADITAYVRSEAAKWGDLIKKANIKFSS